MSSRLLLTDGLVERHNFPSTRFLGSKLKILPWINKHTSDLEFDTALDAFGGTGSVSYLFKSKGKRVSYNDILKFNQQIGSALIENKTTQISDDDLKLILKPNAKIKYPNFIQSTFRGMYFTQNENKWLDEVVTNIKLIGDKYKRAIALSALIQSCLIKRPFNLFHRNNLYLRFNDVERSFGNKVSWDTPFPAHFCNFIKQYNQAIFDNGEDNKVIGGKDVLKLSRNFDLIYLDPPYLSKKSKINYMENYHFIEGLVQYDNWKQLIDENSSIKRLKESPDVNKWLDSSVITELFRQMISRFKDSIIVLSYRNEGIPTLGQIIDLFLEITHKTPKVKTKNYKYALSNGSTKEVLFISEP